MKFEDIQPLETPETLDEAKMTTSVFDGFINSDEADGIQAGFEAELIFRGAAEPGGIDYDADPDMDDSEDTRPDSIDEICDFFHDGDHNDSRDVEKLRDQLVEEYYEWRDEKLSEGWSEVEESVVQEYIAENDWDQDEIVEEYLRDELELSEANIEAAMEAGKTYRQVNSVRLQNKLKDGDMAVQWFAEANDHANEMLDEKVRESISNGDDNFENARQEWEEYNADDLDEASWLRDNNLRWMTDVYRNYRINWPYWTYPELDGGYTQEAAQRVADSLETDLDLNVKVSSGYHSAKRRPGLWIFEPDSSLEPDDEEDLPVEIISPPMPIKETLEILPLFFQWAEENDAYANDSTGFHVGVSLPHTGGRIDYLKLALFLGDQYVLDKFDRSANYFCRSALEKIKGSIDRGDIKDDEIADTMKLLKHDLIELANKTLKTEKGHGKYTSINLKNDYVEFRSMGSEKYVGDAKKVASIVDTVKRYAYAMHIASRPDLFRDEYAKKLYKLLDKSFDSSDAIQQFADYVAAIGGADKQTVKNFIMIMRTDDSKDAPLPDRKLPVRDGVGKSPTGKYWWNVQWDGNRRMEVVAKNKTDAREVARREWGVSFRQAPDSELKVTVLRPYKDEVKHKWKVYLTSNGGSSYVTVDAADRDESIAAGMREYGTSSLDTSRWTVERIDTVQNAPGGVGNYAIISGGNQVFRVTASSQGEANQLAREWLAGRSEEYRQEHAGEEVEVVPLTQPSATSRLNTDVPWPFASAPRP